MNFRLIFKKIGHVLICEAALMIIPLLVAIIYKGHDIDDFVYAILITLSVGIILSLLKTGKQRIHPKEGIAIVSISWFMISLFGALPFLLSGVIPNVFDSFFEAVSGFTTTGATILPEVESLPKGILFWRSFTHWIGGLGVLVFFVAILPGAGAESLNIINVESTGPTKDKMLPRAGQTAKTLYLLYSAFTVFLVVLLVAGRMPLYDAFIHAFGTVGTGGFSNKNISMGYYDSAYLNMVLAIFMIMFGTNLSLIYFAIKGNVKALVKNSEFLFYIGVVGISTVLIAINIFGPYYRSFADALMHSFFQVASIITTTGYATADFNNWPYFSKMILFLLMFIGGCAGSTAGGMKNIRVLLLLKNLHRELSRALHPMAVKTVKVRGKAIDESVISTVGLFFFAYIFIFLMTTLFITFEGHDFEVAMSAAATCIGNVGPGFGAVGPMGNFSVMSNGATLLLSINMLIGRLEIFPVLLLVVPAFWKRV